MRHLSLGYSSVAGLVVVIFVVLVGALGYTYITHYNAQVASSPSTGLAKNTTPDIPAITSKADLDNALSALDSTASVDAQLNADFASIEAATADL